MGDAEPQGVGQWPTGRLLSAVARRIEREWNTHLDAWGLNHASIPVLFHLASGPRSQRELAEASNVTEQTMSRIVARLDRSGYVERHSHPHDRRRHRVALTPSGWQALRQAGDSELAERMSVRGLEPQDVATLRVLLNKMIDADADRAGVPGRSGTDHEGG
ncbi:MarR family winged helix-turn-helix transcriptional regulator [Cellulomonas bogoriensis]|uniref:ArsR family transcriptional regulator n=1 Tax=Cellulomonas bogoriensis 69B4 = DSM 16987 TaxID=1386082 RepID=A0A0A0C3T2_9CELL|nr:MarR family winged helix-turn-helix transcriptional regulator [Cellulomonas bogoriensis]KGM14044.1 ArsR family transcriptional regulator [Cellulomonas bogoriensis 69B4 = DSM 16987]